MTHGSDGKRLSHADPMALGGVRMSDANRLYFGDCLDVMRQDIPSESVDLIYLDPPFNSKRLYSAPIGSKVAGAAFLGAAVPRLWAGLC